LRPGDSNWYLVLLNVPDVVLWTTVAAAGGAVGAAVLTGIVTYKVTDRQVVSSEGLARAQRQLELDMAKEDRFQERLTAAYTSIMQHVAYWTRWVDRSMIRARSNDPDDEGYADAPDVGNSPEAFALLVISGEVARRLSNYNLHLHDFRMKWQAFRVATHRADQAPDDPDFVAFAYRRREDAEAVGSALKTLGDALAGKMREELGAQGGLVPWTGNPPPWADDSGKA
jgi:hypothetical protein